MHSIWRNSPFLRCMAGKQLPLNFGTSLLFVADAFLLAGSPSQSSLRDASSPKVGALGSPHKVHLFAKASPFGRGVTAGDGEGEDADHGAALSQKAALQMSFSVTTPPVKMRLERSAERDKREIINNNSADDAQSNAERIQNRLPQNRYKENPWNL